MKGFTIKNCKLYILKNWKGKHRVLGYEEPETGGSNYYSRAQKKRSELRFRALRRLTKLKLWPPRTGYHPAGKVVSQGMQRGYWYWETANGILLLLLRWAAAAGKAGVARETLGWRRQEQEAGKWMCSFFLLKPLSSAPYLQSAIGKEEM